MRESGRPFAGQPHGLKAEWKQPLLAGALRLELDDVRQRRCEVVGDSQFLAGAVLQLAISAQPHEVPGVALVHPSVELVPIEAAVRDEKPFALRRVEDCLQPSLDHQVLARRIRIAQAVEQVVERQDVAPALHQTRLEKPIPSANSILTAVVHVLEKRHLLACGLLHVSQVDHDQFLGMDPLGRIGAVLLGAILQRPLLALQQPIKALRPPPDLHRRSARTATRAGRVHHLQYPPMKHALHQLDQRLEPLTPHPLKIAFHKIVQTADTKGSQRWLHGTPPREESWVALTLIDLRGFFLGPALGSTWVIARHVTFSIC